MPLVPGLDQTAAGLEVSYRATAEPQDVTIELTLGQPAGPIIDYPAVVLRQVLTSANLGSAGGTVFPPTGGVGVVQTETNAPTHYQWQVRLGGIDPLHIRSMVEHLGSSGDVTFLRIVGTTPLDDSAYSVNTALVRRWLDDPHAYPGEWPHPGFAVKTMGTWPGFRLQTQSPIDAQVRHALEMRALVWLTDIQFYVADNGAYDGMSAAAEMPRTGAGGCEFAAAYRRLEVGHRAARARLVNSLAQFHETVAPLQALEVPA